MTDYILDVIVDGVASTVSLSKIPSTLTLRLRKIEATYLETVVATKQVLP